MPLSNEQKITGYKNRIQQLEEEYFTHEVHSEEAEMIGDSESYNHFLDQMESVKIRIDGLTEKVQKLSELVANNSEDETNGSSV